MSLIINIDTALETGSVALARDGAVLKAAYNDNQKDHASWLHTAIRQLFAETGLTGNQLNAVAVTSGPGSYTGIRVGMATAKGLAYALKLPLITMNTLMVMAHSMVEYNKSIISAQPVNADDPETGEQRFAATKLTAGSPAEAPVLFYCPMIDARRDEVFTAVYNKDCEPEMQPCAFKLSDDSYARQLETGPVLFFGNGSDKWRAICHHPNAVFQKWDYAYFNLAYLSHMKYQEGEFADLAYVQPEYLKEFFTYQKK